MLRFVLLLILLIFIARVVRRVVSVSGGVTGRWAQSGPPQRGVQMVRDPVCGTYVIRERALSLTDGGTPLFFCSASCRDKYRTRTA